MVQLIKAFIGVAAVVAVLGLAQNAGAQTKYGGGQSNPGGEVDDNTDQTGGGSGVTPTSAGGPTQIQTDVGRPAQAEAPGGGSALPVTGGDIMALTAVGVGSIAVGALLVARRRRTPTVA